MTNMTADCAVVTDLLPLYYDRVCSPQSRALVEAHLAGCASCRGALAALGQNVGVESDHREEAAPMRALASLLRRNRWLAFFVGAFVVALVGSIASAVTFRLIGATVDAEGILNEPFFLVPIGMLLGLIALGSGIAAVAIMVRRRIA